MVRRKNFGYFNIFKKKFKSWTKKINQSIKKIKPLSQEKLEKYEKAIKYKIQKGIRKFNISLDSYKKNIYYLANQ